VAPGLGPLRQADGAPGGGDERLPAQSLCPVCGSQRGRAARPSAGSTPAEGFESWCCRCKQLWSPPPMIADARLTMSDSRPPPQLPQKAC